jgi:NAD(P)-dependent dehydrogenase (short-subunit alcohol dehydrogenase family)
MGGVLSSGHGTVGQVVLITGCSQGGMGFEIALEFARKGCTVYATSRSHSTMTALSMIPSIHCLELDVANRDQVEAVVQQVLLEQGRIDVLFNNAGACCCGPSRRLKPQQQQLGLAAQTRAVSAWRPEDARPSGHSTEMVQRQLQVFLQHTTYARQIVVIRSLWELHAAAVWWSLCKLSPLGRSLGVAALACGRESER